MTENYMNSSELNKLLQELIDMDYLRNPALGIAKQIMTQGEDSLSEKQTEVFNKYVLEKYEGYSAEDLYSIRELEHTFGYEHDKALMFGRELKAHLGYIPNGDSPEGDVAYMYAASEDWDNK